MELLDYLKQAVEDGASDIFIVAGGPISYKLEGRFVSMSKRRAFPGETEELLDGLYRLANRGKEKYVETGDDDFSFALPGIARFRVSAYRQRGSVAAVIRIVSFTIPDYQKLHIPEKIMDLADLSHGVVFITGTAGSGKSTTQACIIDRINRTRESHIVTLEDPIEYLHRDQKSIISQREIAIDTVDYPSALRACLRQAPDVILLGEMWEDCETIRTALTAAETGRLVIATLHTRGAVNTIGRVIDTFPAAQQSQIRVQLSMVLNTVVSQQLLPDVDGGMLPAMEILHMNNTVRNFIRRGEIDPINQILRTGRSEGMISMDQSIIRLLQKKKITLETALAYADILEEIQRETYGQ